MFLTFMFTFMRNVQLNLPNNRTSIAPIHLGHGTRQQEEVKNKNWKQVSFLNNETVSSDLMLDGKLFQSFRPAFVKALFVLVFFGPRF